MGTNDVDGPSNTTPENKDARLHGASRVSNGVARTPTHPNLIVAWIAASIAMLVVLAVLAVPASASVTPNVTQTFLQNGTETVEPNPAPGSHYDFRQLMTPTYNPAGNGDGNQGDDLKRLIFDWPAGLIGDPNVMTAATRCDTPDYNGGSAGTGTPADVTASSGSPDYGACPIASRIGQIRVVLTASAWVGECDMNMTGYLHLLRNRPSADPEVPTYIGIHIGGTPTGGFLNACGAAGAQSMDMTAKITLRPNDTGLRLTVVDDMPRDHYTGALGGTAQIKVLSVQQTAWGMISGKPFLTLPTRCSAWVTQAFTAGYDTPFSFNSDVDPVDGTLDTTSDSTPASYTPSPCAPTATGFGFSMTTTNSQAGRPVGVRATLTNPVVTTNALQPSYAKTFALQLPVGYKINPAIANRVGSVGCTESQFLRPQPGTPVSELAPTCPAASEVGTTAVTAPEITGSLVGRLYLGDPLPGDEAAGIYRLYVYAARGGVVAKFQGRAVADSGTGQVTVTMDNTPAYTSGLPQFNYSTFILDFDSASAGVGSPSSGPVSNPDNDQQMLVNPQVCGSYTANATLTPWTTPAQGTTTFSPSFTITPGVNGSCSFNAFDPAFSASVSDTGVGKHPDLNLTVTRLDRTDNLRDMTFRLPPGFAGSVNAASICSAGDAAAGTCNSTTPASKVGDVTVQTGSGNETATLNGTVHLTTPDSADTAKLAIIVPAVVGPFDLGSVVIYSHLQLSGTTFFGLDSITTSMPQSIMGIPVLYRSVSLDLDGIVAGKPFLQNPSQCGTLNFQATMVSNNDLSGPSLPGSGSVQTVVKTDTDQLTTGCATQPFNPTLTVTPTSTATDTATGLTVTVSVPQTTTGVTAGTIQHSTVKRVQLSFPSGMEINPAFAGSATACTTADIDAGGSACLVSSKIGAVTVNTPLLASPVTGSVYLETPGATAATRYKIALVLDMPGGKQIIHGSTQVNGSTDLPGGLGAKDSGTGQITADFNNLPDVPYSTFALAFNSATPMFVNPSTCISHTFNGTITPTNGSLSPASRTAAYATSYNGSGGACSGDPWNPTFTQSVSSTAALGHPNLTLGVTRVDKDQDLRDMTFSLPVGLTGAVTATSQICTQVSADAATCGSTHPASILGTIAVGIGSGSSVTVNGSLYNTVAPGTQPSKLTAIVPVTVGPFNLGSMSIPVNVTMRADYGLDAVTVNLPQRYEGIRVHYRSMSMVINGTATQGTGGTGDDASYLTNPSKCQVNTTTASLTSSQNNTVTRSQNFSTTGCPLSFGTTPTMTVSGINTAAQSPTGMTVTVNSAATNPTIKQIRLTFPAGMTVNPAIGNSGSNSVCSTVNINAGGSSCPAASQQGTVTMQTPLLAGTFNGNVYLEEPGTTASDRYKLAMIIALPGRNLIVRGVATVNGATTIPSGGTGSVDSGTGVVVADFDNIPDLAFSNMTMTLSGGNRALMITPTNCASHTINGLIAPNSGGSNVNTTSNFTTSSNCTEGFAPTFSASLSSSAPAANANLTLNVTSGGGNVAQLRNVAFHLPTGLVANTNNVPRCSQASATAATCASTAPTSAVGTVSTGMGHSGEQLTVNGTIYNVTPNAGEPARMQAIIPVTVGPYDLGRLSVPVATSLRADYGIDTTTQLPLRYEGVDVRIRAMSMTINGMAGGNRFMQNPSICSAKTISADMTNAALTTVSDSDGLTISGCPTGFGTAPTISVTPSTTVAAEPVDLTIGVNSAATNPTVKRVQIAFPSGMEINPSFGNGLVACTTANINAGTCNSADSIADVSLTTPLLSTSPVTGKVYLETPGTTAGTRYRVAMIVDLPGRKLITRGAVTVNGSTTIPTGGVGALDSGTGQITADFDNIPDLGFTNLTMAFGNANDPMVVNPSTCASATFQGTISPNSGGSNASPTAAYTPTACTSTFNPSFSAAVSTTTANGHPNLTLNIARPDKDKQLRDMTVHLPTGLTAHTTAVATPCTQASASAGTCQTTAATSEVGSFTTSIGSGTNTLSLAGGKLFLVDRNPSEPARFQAIIPVVVGPFDLGKLTVPVSTSLRSNYGIDATTQLPTRYEGIAVRIRSMQLVFNGTVNGNPFMTNPSKCQSNTVSADFTAADSTPDSSSANNSSSYATDGCNINFGTAPTFSAAPTTTETQAPTGMNITVGSASTNPTIKRVRVQFPAGMSLNPAVGNSGSNTVCSTAAIDAGGAGCPVESNQGTVQIQTPLLPGTFTGEVFLETPGATAATRFKIAMVIHLPGRDMILRGNATVDGATDVTAGGGGSIDSGTGVVVADFDNLPDLGWSSMVLDLDSGPRAMLVNPDNCAAQTINGQISPNSGGVTVSSNPSYTTTLDCAPPFSPTFSASLSTTTAGANPNLVIGISNPGKSRQLRNFNLHLPTGLVADTVSTPRCPQVDAAAGTCNASTAVGSIGTTIGNSGETLAMNGTVYNVVPNASEPARLQAVVPVAVGPYQLGNLSIPVATALRGDYGIDTATQIPLRYEGIAVRLRSMNLTINGMVAGNGFMINPSECQTTAITADMISADSATVVGNQPITIDGCPKQYGTPPTFDVTPSTTETAKPVGLTFDIGSTITNPTTETVTVTFPEGVELNPAAGNGLTACSTAQINAGGAACLATTANLGSVTLDTPLLSNAQTGNIFLETPGSTAATRYRIALVVHLPGSDLIVRGSVDHNGSTTIPTGGTGSTDSGTGRITTTFENIPDLAFDNFNVAFDSGDQALFSNPRACASTGFTADFAPHGGGTVANASDAYTTTSDCSDTFAPTFGGNVSTTASAGNPDLTLSVTRPEKDRALRNFDVSLPTGLVAATTATTRCAQATASAGNCLPTQAVGSVTTDIGTGGDDLSLSGTIYNVTPNASEPARLSAMIPVQVGPFNLGKLTIPVSTSLRADFGVDASAQLPLRYEGIAVRIRTMTLVLNGTAAGNDFMINPSKCQSNTVGSTMTSEGPSADVVSDSWNYSTNACGNFGSAPTISVTPSTLAAGEPAGLTIGVNSNANNPTIKRVQLAMPAGMEVNPAFGENVTPCSTVNIDAGTCNSADSIADVTMTTHLLGTNPTGKVYLESPGTTAGTRYRVAMIVDLPGRKLIVRGSVSLNGSTTIPTGGTGSIDTGNGQLIADFDNIPDLGFTNLQLAFNSGDQAMVVNPETCSSQTFQGTITPNSGGAAASPTAAYTPTGCSAAFNPTFTASVNTTQAAAHPNLTLNVTRPDHHEQLRTLKIGLPVGLVANTTATATTCSQINAAAGNCAVGEEVGSFSTTIGSGADTVALTGGKIYNVTPNSNEPARFQAVIPVTVGPFDLGKLSIPVTTALRADMGVDATTTLPLRYEGIAVRIRTMQMVLNGVAGGNSFITNPSKCQSNTISGEMTSDQSSTNTDTSAFTTTGCAALAAAYNPSISASVNPADAGTPTALTFGVNVPAESSTTSRVQMTLPPGMELSPGVGNGLVACSAAQIDAGGAACQSTSANLGTITLNTPLLPAAQTGNLFLETPGLTSSTRYKMAMVIHLPGRDLILRGGALVDGSSNLSGGLGSKDTGTGQVTADFPALPDLGFTAMTVAFNNTGNKLFVNPKTCGSHTVSSDLTPNAGATAVTRTTNFSVSGGTCSNTTFAPVFTGSLSSTTTAGNPDMTLNIANPNGDQELKSFAINLPEGLVARTTGVPRCAQLDADAGNCIASQTVGTVTTTIGSGSETYALPGTIYNVVPNSNQPARLQAVVPVQVGPFDLGKLSIPVPTTLNSDLTVTASATLPSRYEGIAVRVRSINMVIQGMPGGNRFLVAPSKCGAKTISATMTSDQSNSAADSFNTTITGCPVNFGSSPAMTVSKSTTVAAAPVNLGFTITSSQNNPTIGRVEVDMPAGMSINPGFGNIVGACPTAVINAGGDTCPASSRVATASLKTQLLEPTTSYTGYVYLESPGSTATTRFRLAMIVELPGADLIVRGAIKVDGASDITAGTGSVNTGTGQITADFDPLPDLGFTEMVMDFNTSTPMLVNPPNCALQTFTGRFTPHSAGSVTTVTDTYSTTPIGCSTPNFATSTGFTADVDGASTTTAGSHPSLNLHVTRTNDRAERIKQFNLQLPVGLVANTTATAHCSQANANLGNCQATEQVGEFLASIGSGATPLDLAGQIYNVVPNASEPARLVAVSNVVVGPYDLGKLVLPITTQLRAADLGVNTYTTIPTLYEGIAVKIKTMDISLYGLAGPSSNPFISAPSKCQSHTITASIVSENNTTVNKTSNFTTTGCPRDFQVAPTLDVSVTPSETTVPTGLGVTIGSDPLNSTISRIQVALPPSVSINAAVGNGLATCSTALINAGGSGCPVSSQQGTVEVTTPLLGAVQTGEVFLEDPGSTAATRYKLAVVVHLPGTDMIVRGKVLIDGSSDITGGTGAVDSGTGQITTDFDSIPDLAWSEMQLDFNTGPRALLTNPDSCGSHNVDAVITPTTAGVNANVSDTFSTSYDGLGAPCPGTQPFSPTFTASASTYATGANPDLTLDVDAGAKDQALREFNVSLPAGLVADTDAVTQCTQASAAAGTCASTHPTSQVGTVTTKLGTGTETYDLSGAIHNVVPESSEPARLQAIIPVVVGPYDLGDLSIPVPTSLRGGDYGVDTATSIPTRYEGILVRIAQMTMQIDGVVGGNDFMKNPSKCGALTIGAEMISAGAQTVNDSESYTVTGCPQNFAIPPTVTVASSEDETAMPTGLTLTIDSDASNPTIESVVTTMPDGMTLNPAVGNSIDACPTATIDAGATGCPAASEVADVELVTPLLPGTKTGKVYLESPGTTAATRYKLAIVVDLPGTKLIVRGVTEVDGSSDLTNGMGATDTGTGRVVASFPSIPDLSFTQMKLTFHSGPDALLTNAETCGAQTVEGEFSPQSGGVSTTDTDSYTTSYDGLGAVCPAPGAEAFSPSFSATVSTTQAAGNPDLTLNVGRSDKTQQLRQFDLHLPPGLVANTVDTPRCSQANAAIANCGSSMRVGDVTTAIGTGSQTLSLTGGLFNVIPDSNEPARLAAIIDVVVGPYDLGSLSLPVTTEIVSGALPSDLAIDTHTTIPNRYEGVPVRMRSMQIQIDGIADQGTPSSSDDKPFMINPSQCTTHTITADMESPLAATASVGSNFTTTNCAGAPYNPAVSAALSTSEYGQPVGLDLGFQFTGNSSSTKKIVTRLPEGMDINPGVGNYGLSMTCAPADVAAGGGACPAASKLGDVTLDTPLLPTQQTGAIYLEHPGATAATRYKLGIFIDLPGTGDLVVHGGATVDGSSDITSGTGSTDSGTGRVTASFDNLPDLQFSNLQISFKTTGGSDHALLTNPTGCGSFTVEADMSPWSNPGTVTTATDNFDVDYDGASASCPGTDPYGPNFGGSVSDTQAGGHPDLSLTVTRSDKHQQIRDLDIHLPIGFVANAQVVPQCTQVSAVAGTCAATQPGSQVGAITTMIGSGTDTFTLAGTIHNVVPNSNEPARLVAITDVVVGPYDLGVLSIPVTTSLRSDMGVDVSAQIPQRYEGIPVRLRSLQMDIDGVVGGQNFLINPSKCQFNMVTADVEAVGGTIATGSFGFGTTNCAGLSFNPAITADVSPTETVKPTGFDLGITIPNGHSTLAGVAVTLPVGMEINPAFGNVVAACPQATVNAGGSGCPAGSQVGTVDLVTPLLAGTQNGEIFMTDPGATATDRYKLAMVVHLPGQSLVVNGVANVNGEGQGADNGTGQVVATFSSVPDLPFTSMDVSFDTGDEAMLTNPETCGAHTVSASLTPSSGTGAIVRTDGFSVSYDGIGGACPGTDGFAPTFTGSVSTTQAGGNPDLILQVTRPDKNRPLRTLDLSLPAGLVADTVATPRCSQVDAGNANCAANTQVGSIVTVVGSGPETYTLNGAIHNVTPNSNEPARLAAVVPVVVGPYDLGDLSIPVTTTLRSGDLGIDTTTTIPTRYEGVPVRVRSLQIQLDGTVNGNGFMINPSRCTSHTVNAEMGSTSGVPVTDSFSFTTTGCPSAFNPSITASVSDTESGQPAGLSLDINVPSGHSSIKRVATRLPVGMEINPAFANANGIPGGLAACSAATIDAGGAACPAASVMGTVELDTPLLAGTQSGTIYLETPGTAPNGSDRYKLAIVIHLPGTDLVMHGAATVDGTGSGADSGTGRVTAVFDDVPDVQFSQMRIDFNTGDDALLTNPESCGIHTVSADLTPWSDDDELLPPDYMVTRTDDFSVSYDGAGAPCPGTIPQNPTFTASLSDYQAGANADVTLTLSRPDKDKGIREFAVRLPQGLVGSAAATDVLCTQVVADAGNCGANSRVGDVAISVGSGPDTFELPGTIHNTVAPSNRPAKLTVITPVVVGPFDLGKVVIPVDVNLDPNDYSLEAETLAPIPQRFEGVPVRIRQLQMVMFGTADQDTPSTADDKPFMSNPRTCAATAPSVEADISSPAPATMVTRTAQLPQPITGCGSLALNNSVDVANTPTDAQQPTVFTAQVNQSAAPTQATLKTMQMAMPGFRLNAPAADGLSACTAAQLDAQSCPASSEVGDAWIDTQLLPLDSPNGHSLEGKVYLETPGTATDGSDRYKLAVQLTGKTLITIRGIAAVNETTGDMVTTFDGLPDIPFTAFHLELQGATNPLLINPETCGSSPINSTMTPHAGSTVIENDTVNVTNCVAHPFNPSVGVTLSTMQSGAHPDAEFTIDRPDGNQDLKSITMSLPAGFVGSAAAVPMCPVASAQAGTCSSASKIGDVLVKIGNGSSTLSLPGDAYLTEGQSGDIAGMAVKVAAVAGPYNLGDYITLGRIVLRQSDHGIDVVFNDIPKMFKGVPTQLQQMRIAMDGIASSGKPFLYNASTCDPWNINTALGSYDATNVSVATPYQATGCPGRPFNPAMSFTASGGDENNTPEWNIKMNLNDGDSTMKSTQVLLPSIVTANAMGIGTLCEEAQISAWGCPAATKTGEVTVTTPLLPYKVVGDVFVARGQSSVLPDMLIQVGAPINLQIRGRNRFVNEIQIQSTFEGLPDMIWTEMNMKIYGGSKGLLTTREDGTCGAASGQFGSNSGQSVSAGVPVNGLFACEGGRKVCENPAVSVSTKGAKKKGNKKSKTNLSLSVPSSCSGIKSVSVLYPKGTKVQSKLMKYKKKNKKLKKNLKNVTGKAGSKRLVVTDFKAAGKNGLKIKSSLPAGTHSISIASQNSTVLMPYKTLCGGITGAKKTKKAKSKKCQKKLISFTFVITREDGSVLRYVHQMKAGDKKLK